MKEFQLVNTVGQPALRSGRPGDTQGTEEDQRRDGGKT